jgi:hypothetical protein
MLKSGYAARPHPCGLNTRSLDAGYFTSIAGGLIGRGEKLPPQFGQRPFNRVSTQSRQNEHSNVQIIASIASGGRSLSQHSQPGFSTSRCASPCGSTVPDARSAIRDPEQPDISWTERTLPWTPDRPSGVRGCRAPAPGPRIAFGVWRSGAQSLRRERLIQIRDEIRRVLQPDRQPHHIRPGAGGDLLLVGQLAVRRRRGMNNQRARVADIGEMREQF